MNECRRNAISLSESENGSIIKCSCCDCFQITFNNVIISFKESEYRIFRNAVESFIKNRNETESQTGRNILIRTSGIDNLVLAFNKEELEALIEMIDEANYMDSVFKIVMDNKSVNQN